MQGFTAKTSTWQNADAPAAGINPLMQTPAPATSTSVLTPDAAAVKPNRTAQAVLRKTKISPKKLNEAARLIRRMHIDDALVQCQIAPQKAAKLCYKVKSQPGCLHAQQSGAIIFPMARYPFKAAVIDLRYQDACPCQTYR